MNTTETSFIDININTWQGAWPQGHELVVHERGGDPDDGYVLYGFDEIGEFDDEFAHAAYSFVSINA